MRVFESERINFHNPGVNKPASLQNSAVLRFLEEEESRNRGGSPNLKRVAWPPPPDRDGHFEEVSAQDLQQHHYQQPATLPRYHQTIPKVEPPPSTITLRPQAPVSQIPAPVYTSQPATATLQGGKNLRGDLKWPPPETKAQMEEENRKRIELARGPVCRPRKVARDYRDFFAQHALNSTYPRYKIPPGTQFYVRE
uniref:Zasp-like motif domain-containing protein n=1 Tax=Photinus pyralis TaxID=7054 RepID=A0A1Y1LDA7_PHOPY